MSRQSELSTVLAKIEQDIQELTRIKTYLTNGQPTRSDDALPAPKKRGRKAKKAETPDQAF